MVAVAGHVLEAVPEERRHHRLAGGEGHLVDGGGDPLGPVEHGRGEHHDGGVDVVASQGAAEHRPVAVGVGAPTQVEGADRAGLERAVRAQVDGVARARSSARRPARSATVRPARRASSAARRPGWAALAMTATRSPAGSGWLSSSRATWNSSASVGTSMTPAWARSAEWVPAAGQKRRPIVGAGRSPVSSEVCRATIGLARPMRRAMRKNLRGFPNDSRYSTMTSVPGSSSQNCMRSLPLTSPLSPRLTKQESPIPHSVAISNTVAPTLPDWVDMATVPAAGQPAATVARRRTAGSLLTTPTDAGPTRRMPWPRASVTSSSQSLMSSCSAALSTTRPSTCLRAQSTTTAGTSAAGTATTTTSTSSGTSATLAYARTDLTCRAARFTGYTGPSKPPSTRQRSTSWPTVIGSRLAPTTATEPGRRRRATERASASRARSAMRSTPSAVGSIPRVTSTTPSAKVVATSNPAQRNTRIISRFAGNTVAMNPVMPFSLAATARYSSNSVARPRPWWASSTKKATSARRSLPKAS